MSKPNPPECFVAGEILQNRMNRLHLSDARLGNMVGAAPATVRKWRNGNFPTEKFRGRLAVIFGLDFSSPMNVVHKVPARELATGTVFARLLLVAMRDGVVQFNPENTRHVEAMNMILDGGVGIMTGDVDPLIDLVARKSQEGTRERIAYLRDTLKVGAPIIQALTNLLVEDAD